jgi:hypothetical protein
MTSFALFYTNTLSWIFIVLAHWNNSPWIDMLLHSYSLSWFRANQSLLFLPNTNFIIFSLTPPGLVPTIYHKEATTLTITPPMRLIFN